MATRTFEVQKVLPGPVNCIGGGILRLSRIDIPKDADNIAYFEASVFRSLFGTTRSQASMAKKKLAVVKIQYENNPPLYRAYEAVTLTGFNSKCIGLSPNTIRLLSADGRLNPENCTVTVTVSPGSQRNYMKFHPDPIVSTSYRSSRRADYLGVLSIILGAISVVASWDNLVKIVKTVLDLFCR